MRLRQLLISLAFAVSAVALTGITIFADNWPGN
jgi:hypothetical protein